MLVGAADETFSFRFDEDVVTGMSQPEPIRLFVTGGTFDKEYDEIRGALFFKDTHVAEMLALGRSKLDVAVRTLMMVDSLDRR